MVGIGLRNEVREWLLQGINGRDDWYKYMGQAARAVHAAHPDALILIGGTLSSTDLIHIKASGLVGLGGEARVGVARVQLHGEFPEQRRRLRLHQGPVRVQ